MSDVPRATYTLYVQVLDGIFAIGVLTMKCSSIYNMSLTFQDDSFGVTGRKNPNPPTNNTTEYYTAVILLSLTLTEVGLIGYFR